MNNKSKNQIKNQTIFKTKGQVMLLSVLLIGGTILAASSIAGYLMLLRIRASSDITNSTKAIFAADTGLEWELYKYFKGDIEKPLMTNDSSFESQSVDNESGAPQYIKSIGKSNKAFRAFTMTFEISTPASQ